MSDHPIQPVLVMICWVVAIVAFFMAMLGNTTDAEATRVIALMAVTMIGVQA